MQHNYTRGFRDSNYNGSPFRNDWLKAPHKWLISSAIITGSGKSYLPSAFGVSACRQFYKIKYIRLPELLDELSLAKLVADGSYRKLIKKYTKVDLLILDGWLLTDLSTDEAAILLEIAESRHKVASTIFCSQIDPRGCI